MAPPRNSSVEQNEQLPTRAAGSGQDLIRQVETLTPPGAHTSDAGRLRQAEAALPTITLTDGPTHPDSIVIHGRNGRCSTVAAMKAQAGESLAKVIQRLHPDLPEQRLQAEIKHILKYNRDYGNDLGDGTQLAAGKNVYLTSVKFADDQGRVNRIQGPSGRITEIGYDAGGVASYKITNADGTVVEQAQKRNGTWSVTRDGKTEQLRDVAIDQWGDLTLTGIDGNKVGHLTRGDDVATTYKDGKAVKAETISDGAVTTTYDYEYKGGNVKVYAVYAANPGQRVLIEDTSNLAQAQGVIDTPGYADISSDNYASGFISAKYETGGGGDPGAVNIDPNHAAGMDYGTFQFNESAGIPQAYVQWAKTNDPGVYNALSGQLGSVGLGANGAFGKTWKEIAREHPQEFAASQRKFALHNYLDPLTAAYSRIQKSPALQEAAFATSIQFGTQGASSLMVKAGANNASISDMQFLKNLTDQKIRAYPNNTSRYVAEGNDEVTMLQKSGVSS